MRQTHGDVEDPPQPRQERKLLNKTDTPLVACKSTWIGWEGPVTLQELEPSSRLFLLAHNFKCEVHEGCLGKNEEQCNFPMQRVPPRHAVGSEERLNVVHVRLQR